MEEKINHKKITITGVKTELAPKKKNIFLRILIYLFVRILLLLFIALFLYIGFNVGKYMFYSKANTRVFYEISRCVTRPYSEENITNEPVIDFTKLREINAETVGWIKVQNAEVNLPIVKTKDNDFYLYHNYFKGTNSSGWIFVDCSNKLDGTDKNIVLYGKNYIDGTMFGSLKNILTSEWLDNNENKIITYRTPNEIFKYEVFSVYKIKGEEDYTKTNFAEDEFDIFLETIKSRSLKKYETVVTSADSILTLTTWGNDNLPKVVLHAKKIVFEETVPESSVPENPVTGIPNPEIQQ